MIPFLKPNFDHRELFAVAGISKGFVEEFEREFARKFGSKFALSFSSGRSALYCTLRALNITNAEVVLPAYTCVVVAHAIVLSKNIPVFVDISLDDFNMDLRLLFKRLSSRTKAVIATSLFGYPIQLDEIRSLCGEDVLIIHDCALAPRVKYNGTDVGRGADITTYSLNVRKPVSALGGGMIGTDDEEIFRKVKEFRERNQGEYSSIQRLGKLIFFLSQFLAFDNRVHKLVDLLVHRTHFLDSLLIDYSEDTENIPNSYFRPLLDSQARIGLVQLEKYDDMIKKRQKIAEFYYENLRTESSVIIPPLVEGAIYSHYCIRVDNRYEFINSMRKSNISAGSYFDYCIPELKPYQIYKNGEFPNCVVCSKEIVNLPNHPGLGLNDLKYIIRSVSKSSPKLRGQKNG